ncbi:MULTISPECIES: flavin reductase family protein [unclassified Enterococcus]|uniref:flavin reductase family protein n=1 Tax=unclassified Enterococcus TaxID=2608891 RepID=UPI0015555C1F|nr:MULTISPECIES: flavin reductase family protein [unclassified Enterococcus]MBS7577474.1 flavin reductase family protein [Enterococcus sp. MMGLQ5-2]MBS7584880.1 flavin reductase family protein [Enterococcus sp. MMGLQ5-1]NPD12735.1 flavin reductase family protein [Enterococcus sp. MMGLQ5-1]NPD37306.1 flavin reductase family protein [Enterococcus sp. MMGLQ5-2]
MKHFKPEQLSSSLQYKLLTGIIVPRPIAWITTQNTAGIVNAAPFSFFNAVAVGKPLLSVAILNGGMRKDTANNLLQTKEAVVHLINPDNVKEMNLTAKNLPSTVSELASFGIETQASELISVPSIKNSSVRFETVLYQHIPIIEKELVLTDFFLLEIKNFIIDERIIDLNQFYISTQQLKPIARLAGNEYAELGNIFNITRPS